ncbi:MAG TPA: heme-copper oxidase subunit III [Candidatus Thermoplasmatota archaeon]|nr:heme-copper oxidase subunit III [Candidatus Thermoplasmatota archaeon]
MAHAAPTAHPAGEGHAHVEEHHGSFMPLWLTIGTTIFLFGLLQPVLALVGFLIMAASVVGWIREDVHELSGKPFSTGSSEYLWGSIILILSEVVLFGILFTFYFWSRAHTEDFIPRAILEMDMLPIYINTAVLISSGVTVEVAKWRLKKDDVKGFRIWMALTILLGLIFLGGQVLEYSHLMHEGLTTTSSVYGTAFYSLTGVHGLHVLAGVIVLSLLFALSFTGFVRKERLSGMEGAFLYWHFVDLIWVLVFSFIYLRVI